MASANSSGGGLGPNRPGAGSRHDAADAADDSTRSSPDRAGLRGRLTRRRLVSATVVAVVLVAAGVAVKIALPWWSDRNLAPAQERIAAGTDHTCAIARDGSVRCWGENSSGQLGDGTTNSTSTPVAASGLRQVAALTAGGAHTCALTQAGAVWCWGANGTGQLGNGTTMDSAVPVRVSGLTSEALAISTSETHTCALLSDRSVECWGDNGSGQLGTGDTKSSNVPVAVKDLPAHSTAVATGTGFSCVGFTGRTVRCWGDNSDGQLGVGDLSPRMRWEPVVGLPRAKIIAAGDASACAVTDEGQVFCWGSNAAGQLGTTTQAQAAAAPLAVPGISGSFVTVAAGATETCAATTSGQATCWGGEVGESVDPSDARVVTGVNGIQDLAVGGHHVCATTSGHVYCWGRNDRGQLGNGGGGSGGLPVAVTGF